MKIKIKIKMNLIYYVIHRITNQKIGAGMAMTMGCDIRVVSADAKIGFTFVKLGLPVGNLSI